MKTLAILAILGNLSLDQAVKLNYAYGEAQQDRDATAGYPSLQGV